MHRKSLQIIRRLTEWVASHRKMGLTRDFVAERNAISAITKSGSFKLLNIVFVADSQSACQRARGLVGLSRVLVVSLAQGHPPVHSPSTTPSLKSPGSFRATPSGWQHPPVRPASSTGTPSGPPAPMPNDLASNFSADPPATVGGSRDVRLAPSLGAAASSDLRAMDGGCRPPGVVALPSKTGHASRHNYGRPSSATPRPEMRPRTPAKDTAPRTHQRHPAH